MAALFGYLLIMLVFLASK